MINIKSCVVQEQKYGCAISCIATILRKTYWEIERHFSADFNKTGLTTKQIFDYLSGEGFDLILKQQMSWSDRLINNKRLSIPFADIHILSYKTFSDKEILHATIMNKQGNIYCPKDGKPENLKSVYLVVGVMGVWYPKGWKFKK